MGEWSKKVGDAGEAVVADFLRMIGWGASQHGVQFQCLKPERHGAPNHSRRTHGIDYLFTYKSPLADRLAINLVISVKYSADPYPKNPANRFKEHLTDLAQTVECFKNSEVRRDTMRGVKGVTRAQDVGVLIWINNDKKGDQDVIRHLQRTNLPDSVCLDLVYLVDNRRAQFVYDTIQYARKLNAEGEVKFFAHETGKNLDTFARVQHGQILPVECVNSTLLALALGKEGTVGRSLMLSTLEQFSEASLKRLMGLSQHLSQGWCSRVIIAFPDFDELHHANVFQGAKGCFVDAGFAAGVELHNYDGDFRTRNG